MAVFDHLEGMRLTIYQSRLLLFLSAVFADSRGPKEEGKKMHGLYSLDNREMSCVLSTTRSYC